MELPAGRRAFPNKWVLDYVQTPKVLEEKEKQWKDKLLGQEWKATDLKFKVEMLKRMKDLQSSGVDGLEKARLMACGDLQKEGIDYKDTFAPVVKFVSLRVLLQGAAKQGLATRHWDIVLAFLHGDMDVETFMQQPPGCEEQTNRVC